MNGLHSGLLLACIIWVVRSHIEEMTHIQEEAGSDRIVRLSPISVVNLIKTSRRVSRADAEKNKKKDLPKKKSWTPPANCVPLKSSCRPPAPPCCEPCAFCHCHIFQTVCVYKMGNPHC